MATVKEELSGALKYHLFSQQKNTPKGLEKGKRTVQDLSNKTFTATLQERPMVFSTSFPDAWKLS